MLVRASPPAIGPVLLIDQVFDGKLLRVSQNPQITKVAPVVGLNISDGTLLSGVVRLHRLAAALGAPANADADAKARYDAAADRLKAAIAAKPGLPAAFCLVNPGADLRVNAPDKYIFPKTLTSLGMKFPTISGPASAGFGTDVSWENVSSMPIDLIFYYNAQPTGTAADAWRSVPAVKAGQAVYFDKGGTDMFLLAYDAYTRVLDRVTNAVSHAHVNVGPAS